MKYSCGSRAGVDDRYLDPRRRWLHADRADIGDHANLDVSYQTRTTFGNATQQCSSAALWNAGYSNLPAAMFACQNGYVGVMFFQPLNGNTVFLESLNVGSWRCYRPITHLQHGRDRDASAVIDDPARHGIPASLDSHAVAVVELPSSSISSLS